MGYYYTRIFEGRAEEIFVQAFLAMSIARFARCAQRAAPSALRATRAVRVA
jgi:hypothetical protein